MQHERQSLMPRIKVYKGAGKMIPIEEAKIASAFRCPWTKKVYGSKRDYVKHLKHLRENYMHKRVRAAAFARKKEMLWNQPTFEAVLDWIHANPEFMFDNGYREGWTDNGSKKYRDQFWVKITYLKLDWTPKASNTHDCPRGGVTNWALRDYNKPTGYPGYTGHIEFQTSHNLGFGSDLMRNLGIHTGIGGLWHAGSYGFGVTFFDADWPGIVQSRTMDLLADREDWKTVRIGKPIYFGR